MTMDTKNKKGRPKQYPEIESIQEWFELQTSRRAKQNLIQAEAAFNILPDYLKSFFLDNNCNLKRRGILEQIGRLLTSGNTSEQECINLTAQAIDDYYNGMSCKEIEKYLRMLRSFNGNRQTVSDYFKPKNTGMDNLKMTEIEIKRYIYLAEHKDEVNQAILNAREKHEAVTHGDVILLAKNKDNVIN